MSQGEMEGVCVIRYVKGPSLLSALCTECEWDARTNSIHLSFSLAARASAPLSTCQSLNPQANRVPAQARVTSLYRGLIVHSTYANVQAAHISTEAGARRLFARHKLGAPTYFNFTLRYNCSHTCLRTY